MRCAESAGRVLPAKERGDWRVDEWARCRASDQAGVRWICHQRPLQTTRHKRPDTLRNILCKCFFWCCCFFSSSISIVYFKFSNACFERRRPRPKVATRWIYFCPIRVKIWTLLSHMPTLSTPACSKSRTTLSTAATEAATRLRQQRQVATTFHNRDETAKTTTTATRSFKTATYFLSTIWFYYYFLKSEICFLLISFGLFWFSASFFICFVIIVVNTSFVLLIIFLCSLFVCLYKEKLDISVCRLCVISFINNEHKIKNSNYNKEKKL